jgi:hypothetical protein
MDDGRVSISAAALLVDADPGELDAVLQLDPKAVLRVAREIKARLAERRAAAQLAKTVTPRSRPRKERLAATRLIHGDCWIVLKTIPDRSLDLILTDPPYPDSMPY